MNTHLKPPTEITTKNQAAPVAAGDQTGGARGRLGAQCRRGHRPLLADDRRCLRPGRRYQSSHRKSPATFPRCWLKTTSP